MRVSAMNFEGRQQLITESPTLPDHIATKQYVDNNVSGLVATAVGQELGDFQAAVTAQISNAQAGMAPKSAVTLTAGEAADLSLSDYFVLNANGNQVITLSNVASLNGKPKVIIFDIRNTSSLNITWSIPNLTFSRATPPTLTPNGRDLIALSTKDGTGWDLMVASPNAAAAV
ncbi:MAG: hypothetical protein PHN51_12605 [Candidatus Nanopelagicales bacterium]|nr:hypothetical protein [Candidatus Nanopelagicales bacterium]